MSTLASPPAAATAAVPQQRPASGGVPMPSACEPDRQALPDWWQPRPLIPNRASERLYALPTAWHGDRVVAAICQPGKPDGEVATGPYIPGWRVK